MEENKRVLLGMSGGTDSSVAAMRLLEAGYEVIGVTFRFYELNGSTEYLEDARNLAERLGIRHITYDAREIFSKQIIEYFVQEYLAGRTPVPCILCNNYLKWPLLAKIADEMGVFYIATGHYAQNIQLNNTFYITYAADSDKDQTFFLWGLKQDILCRMLLPMGDITKVEARVWAAEHGFRKVATKKDSIGVCFCPMDYRTFLKNWLAQNNEALAEEEQMMGENQALVGDWQVLVGSNQAGLNKVKRGRFVDERKIYMSAFKEINPKEIVESPFKLIGDDWALVTAGDREKFNTMTISWGGVGIMWGKPVVFTFIRPQRYTFAFMENGDRYTMSFFDEKYRDALKFCGSKSGKDYDKERIDQNNDRTDDQCLMIIHLCD